MKLESSRLSERAYWSSKLNVNELGIINFTSNIDICNFRMYSIYFKYAQNLLVNYRLGMRGVFKIKEMYGDAPLLLFSYSQLLINSFFVCVVYGQTHVTACMWRLKDTWMD